MKVIGVVAATVLSLGLAGQSFAQQPDQDNGKAVAVAAPAVVAPAAAGAAAAGSLSTGVIVGVVAVVAVAVAVGVSGGNDTTKHGTGGTTH